jgi:hypothetical protein
MNASLRDTPRVLMASAAQVGREQRWADVVRANWLIFAILTAHVLLGVLYSVAVPLWEAHDEWAHYKYVEYVARHRSLPPIGERLTYEYTYDQANQPQLYYVLAALPVLFVNTSDGLTPQVNPYVTMGTGAGGVNFAIHDPEVERFPFRGTVLAVHLARGVSVLLSALALVATLSLGQLVTRSAGLSLQRSRQISVSALAIAAFSPQFLFIGSVITNDVLIAVLGCWVAVFSLRVALSGSRLRDMVILAGLVGLALLTKYTALALALMALIAAAIGLSRHFRSPALTGSSTPTVSSTTRGRIWAAIAAALLVLAGIAGWWFWGNIRQSGQILLRDPWAVY